MKNKIRKIAAKLTVFTLVFSALFGSAPPALASGSVAWTAGGVKLAEVEETSFRSGQQSDNVIIADGSGGMWQAFRDSSSGNIMLQRFDSSGARLLGASGIAVVSASGTEENPRIVSDGSGGVIVVWSDPRSGNYDVYAQRFNGSGVAQWAANGVAVVTGAAQQRTASIMSSGRDAQPVAGDGSGNVYVVWQEGFSASPIKVQKLNSSGIAQWTANGVSVTSTNGEEASLIHDGSGGAIVAWKDRRNGSAFGEVYAQRINSTGTAVAAANGVFLMGTNARFHGSLHIVSDGAGGAIISAESDRISSSNGIFVQRVNASVAAQWTANGVQIAVGPSFQHHSVADGSGGVVLAWGDNRNFGTADNDVFAQRLNSAGAKQWGAGDVRLTSDVVSEGNALIAADGSGNYVVYWDDDANGSTTSVFAQKLDSSGAIQWTSGGISQMAGSSLHDYHIRSVSSDGTSTFVGADSISSEQDVYAQKTNAAGAAQWGSSGVRAQTPGGTVDQEWPFVVADGLGGYIYTWTDLRNGTGEDDVYAQKVNAFGVTQWGTGVLIAGTVGEREVTYDMVADGAGGAIIIWWNYDDDLIMAQRVDGNGTVHSGWPAGGVAVTPTDGPEPFDLITDGAGGAILGYLGDDYTEIRMNRVTGSGTLPWGASGVTVSDPANDCGADTTVARAMAPDGAGGAYIAWNMDSLASFCSASELRMTRIDSNGSLHAGWTANGNLVSTDGSAIQPAVSSDGSGNMLIAWQVNANGDDIKAQKFNGSGTAQWTANGVSVVTDPSEQSLPHIISDGAGGAVVVWQDQRSGSFHIFAQRLNSSGAPQWTANGVAAGGSVQDYINIAPDGSGGVVMAWGAFGVFFLDIYAQRVDSTGAVKWGSGGMPVADELNSEQFSLNNRTDKQKVVSDGNGGLVVVYEFGTDLTYSEPGQIRTQRVLDSEGDTTPPNISSVAAGSVTSTGATITWTTNEASDSKVNYGLTAGYGSNVTDASLVTSHSVPLSGLSPSTLYHYQVCSKDAALNESCSSDATFTTSTGGSNDPTLANKVVLSRIKAGVSATANVHFTLQNTLSGPLTVTFPVGFTVTAAATGGSACLSGFGFTSSTLTATKTNCSGAISMTGATVTNPGATGIYTITWVNDDPGSASVFIISEDQVNVTAIVDPVLTFNVGAQASATACAGSFAGNGGTVALGSLTTSSVASSDASSVNHICTRLTTNAANGATVTVRSLNASLRSTSVPADTIPSSTTTLVAGTAGYGLCAGSAGADSGFDATTPAGVAPARSAPFNGSCTSGAHDVGALTTSAQNVWTVADASQNAFVRLYIKASISSSTPAHSDYTDTLTFVATGTF